MARPVGRSMRIIVPYPEIRLHRRSPPEPRRTDAMILEPNSRPSFDDHARSWEITHDA